MMKRCKRPGNIMQRLRMSDKEITARKKVVVKRIYDIFLHFIVKINNNITTKYYMGMSDPLYLKTIAQIQLAEFNKFFYIWINAVLSRSLVLKIFFYYLL